MHRWLVSLFVFLLVAMTAVAVRAREGPALRRFAITVAAQDGGVARATLRYAVDDARAVAAVLRELGGVQDSDLLTLVSPAPSDLRDALRLLKERIAQATKDGARTEVVFYYSGHSDETALLLAGARFDYVELRRALDALPADVRIAILDSCASGAFTRLKGGTHRPAFLVDDATKVRGHAFLTSSSADESAQESDRIGGSFFTHYLVSGLRGAADESGDRKVTLSEVYRFAFEETLARTAQTQFGSQHPGFEIRLVGSGDLVMSDLRVTAATVSLEPALEGRLFMWDERGGLLLEVDKPKGRDLTLAVPSGRYKLELTNEGRSYLGMVAVEVSGSTVVGPAALREVAREQTLSRGLTGPPENVPAAVALVPALSTNRRGPPRRVQNGLDLALVYDDPDRLSGFQLSVIGGGVRELARGVQLAGVFTQAQTLHGVQIAGEFNGVKARASGVQLSLGANVAVTHLDGFQLGAINLTRELAGVQAGVVNWGRRSEGMQLGIVNTSHELSGLALGAINISSARVRGAQIGLVNFADEADVSFGALGMTRREGARPQVSFSDVFCPEIALRVEANYNYSFLSVGIAPFGRDDAWAFGGGLGAKVPLLLSYLWLDMDLSMHVLSPQGDYRRGLPNLLLQLRMLPRAVILRRLSVLIGPTFNLLMQKKDEAIHTGLPLARHELGSDDETSYLFWVGFSAGVRL